VTAVERRAGGSVGRLHSVRRHRTASWHVWRRVEGDSGDACSYRAMFIFFNVRGAFYYVSSNPNELAWTGWPNPLGLLYTTTPTHPLPHRRSQSRSHRGASPPPPCCSAISATLLLRPLAMKVLCSVITALVDCFLSSKSSPNLDSPVARPANRTT
jgi:hypothetical protein